MFCQRYRYKYTKRFWRCVNISFVPSVVNKTRCRTHFLSNIIQHVFVNHKLIVIDSFMQRLGHDSVHANPFCNIRFEMSNALYSVFVLARTNIFISQRIILVYIYARFKSYSGLLKHIYRTTPRTCIYRYRYNPSTSYVRGTC